MRSTTSLIVANGLCLLSGLILGARGSSAAEISFRNDVMPVLSKSGCNLGTCHGNARGKGGFQLSLRGQNPSGDYDALTRDWLARRANPTDADQSLLLLKPTMQIAHEGGKRFEATSAEYQVLRDWIAAGMPNDTATAPKLVKLNVTPREVFLSPVPSPPSSGERARVRGPNGEQTPDDKAQEKTTPHPNPLPSKARGEGTGIAPVEQAGWQVQITATAEFDDGSSRSVTSVAVYEVAQPIAEVSHDGLVTGNSVGETTVLVRFLQQQVPVRIAFLPERPGFEFSAPTPANVIDEHVFAKLRKLRINPSPVCEDATFVRRVFLDLLGVLPTATEARQFVADASPNKRAALIDSLLERPEFADWWALKWADLLRIEEKTLDRKGVENFHAWLRDAFATNMPLDRMVREIVGARGSTYEVPPSNFYRALRTPFERSEAVGQLFLGVRLQCAKCHNHPFDRWTQDDYYGWGSVFARVDYKIIENNRRDSNDKHEFDGEQIVFLGAKGEAKDPRTEKTRAAKFLGAKSKVDPKADPLTELADWLTSADNDLFVRMLANRTWQQVMGRGIVDPVDDFRATNPASNPALLKALADELRSDATRGTISVKAPFDLRHLLRLILNSHTYQLSSEPNDTNRDDESNFSRALVQRHSAEQLLDATSQVLDVPLQFAGYPTGPRAAQIPGVRAVSRRRGGGPSDADRFLILFGKPPRLQSCDCERSDETTLTQTFQLVSGDLVNRMLTDKSNRLDALLRSGQPTPEIVRDLYWTTLTRSPTTDELHETTRYVDSATNRRSALEDVTWGLLNSHEFLLRR